MSTDDPVLLRFKSVLQDFTPADAPVGAAVSGGGDSIALLCLLHRSGQNLRAVTVDHGLRAESATEAQGVAELCSKLGIAHDILNWSGPSGSGNLQAAAREARQSLISDWTQKTGVQTVFLGHTLDDQAETFLMRLARGSGVDGLSGMAAKSTRNGVTWIRPLLAFRRETLREWLVSEGISWVDDPSNEDTRFDRVKARQALELLGEFGVSRERLAATSENMSRSREVLETATQNLANSVSDPTDIGEVTLSLSPLLNSPAELRLRLVAWSLQWVSGEVYRPRLAALEELLENQTDCSLHGCLVRFDKPRIIVRREPARVGKNVVAGKLWDGRWNTSGPAGVTVGALGENGLALCPDWRDFGHNREALLTTPAFWRGEELLANPFVKPAPSCDAVLKRGEKDYFNFIVRR